MSGTFFIRKFSGTSARDIFLSGFGIPIPGEKTLFVIYKCTNKYTKYIDFLIVFWYIIDIKEVNITLTFAANIFYENLL